ncbi:hypothetical protein E4U43_003265 [Claviceps pusilla]|uniref:Uncharacterized protein n=1 Tax=Claviceps pusilla TaxID=123648 RepID=A0A9P7SUP1_9HYPO|nr:hypothetical protein E4U43_003265 [Claviceps pusilla]
MEGQVQGRPCDVVRDSTARRQSTQGPCPLAVKRSGANAGPDGVVGQSRHDDYADGDEGKPPASRLDGGIRLQHAGGNEIWGREARALRSFSFLPEKKDMRDMQDMR